MKLFKYKGDFFKIRTEKDYRKTYVHYYLKKKRSVIGRMFYSEYKYIKVYKAYTYDDLSNESKMNDNVIQGIEQYYRSSKDHTQEQEFDLSPAYEEEIVELKEEQLKLKERNKELNNKLSCYTEMYKNIEDNNEFVNNMD